MCKTVNCANIVSNIPPTLVQCRRAAWDDLLSPCQYGFRPGRSCESALATTLHMLSSFLDDRTPCEVLQLDFKQAFDRVDHGILRQKLAKMGISGCLEGWISDFLLNRSQRVVFRGAISAAKSVLSGIPQGSVL